MGIGLEMGQVNKMDRELEHGQIVCWMVSRNRDRPTSRTESRKQDRPTNWTESWNRIDRQVGQRAETGQNNKSDSVSKLGLTIMQVIYPKLWITVLFCGQLVDKSIKIGRNPQVIRVIHEKSVYLFAF